MKKKVFDSSVLGNRYHKSGNHININKAGMIYFSQDMTKELKGKRVNFIQDEARPGDWYIEPTKDASGIEMKFNQKLQRCIIQAAAITRAMCDSLDLAPGSYSMTVSSDSSEGMYAILTKTAAPTNRKSKDQ